MYIGEPICVGMSQVSMMSLMPKGTPAMPASGAMQTGAGASAGTWSASQGFASPQAAAESTLEGVEWCYQNGIYPKYSTWIVSGGAMFNDRPPAPLEYYATFLPGRQRLFAKYDLPVPATDCPRCLTESMEADLARLDPERYALARWQRVCAYCSCAQLVKQKAGPMWDRPSRLSTSGSR